MRIRSQKDFIAGLAFIAVGVAAAAYVMGQTPRSGTGVFAQVLGLLLALIGAVMAASALGGAPVDQEQVGPIAWRPLAAVLGATALFAVLLGGVPALGIPSLGLVVAMLALVLVASLAGGEWRLLQRLVLAVVLAAVGAGVFVLLLKRPLPLWPAFFGG